MASCYDCENDKCALMGESSEKCCSMWTTIKPAEPDIVSSPSHYTDGGIETIDYIRAKLTAEEFRGYCKGNALKYISRAGKKGEAAEDISKAIVYLNWLKGAIE